jgi:hypothetical protein
MALRVRFRSRRGPGGCCRLASPSREIVEETSTPKAPLCGNLPKGFNSRVRRGTVLLQKLIERILLGTLIQAARLFQGFGCLYTTPSTRLLLTRHHLDRSA